MRRYKPGDAWTLATTRARVRAVVRIERAMEDPRSGKPTARKTRVVVTGTVTAWEPSGGQTYVIVDGYGRVEVEACRPKRWWHRG